MQPYPALGQQTQRREHEKDLGEFKTIQSSIAESIYHIKSRRYRILNLISRAFPETTFCILAVCLLRCFLCLLPVSRLDTHESLWRASFFFFLSLATLPFPKSQLPLPVPEFRFCLWLLFCDSDSYLQLADISTNALSAWMSPAQNTLGETFR